MCFFLSRLIGCSVQSSFGSLDVVSNFCRGKIASWINTILQHISRQTDLVAHHFVGVAQFSGGTLYGPT